MPHSVFIAYVAKDRRVAEAACAALEGAGIPCWLAPRNVVAGRPSFGQINEAIRAARLCLLILSKEADSAPQILRQVERAADYYLPVLSLQIEDFTPGPDLQYFLGSSLRLDAYEASDLAGRLALLVKDVSATLADREQMTQVDAPTPPPPDPALATETATLEPGVAAEATLAEPTPAATSAAQTKTAAGATATLKTASQATVERRPKSILEGEKFGHFRVLRKEDGSLQMLGKGAMGVTYKALDTNLERYAALKVVNPALTQDDRVLKRFRREAQAAARLRHPNIASVFYLGDEQGTLFYAMEFVEGETLNKFIQRKGKLEPIEALRLVHQVAQALVAAHRQNLIHRDIKPDNLMITGHDGEDWQIKLIDFGLAKGLEQREGASEASMGGFVGSPAFASPEQCSELELDIRSDIYSLGVTLWFMLTGKVPFTGPVAQVLYFQVSKPPPVEQLDGLPGEVTALLLGMLAKAPEDRPQTPLDLQHALETVLRRLAGPDLTGLPPVATPPPVPRAVPPVPAANATVNPTARTISADDDEDAVATLISPGAGSTAPSPATAQHSAQPPPLPPIDLAAYERLAAGAEVDSGRYRLARLVSDGPCGRLFQARDTGNQELVAVETFRPDLLAADPPLRERIRHRLETAAALIHPNVGKCLDTELEASPPFVVSEWLNGWPLWDLLRRRGVFSAKDVLRLLDGIAEVIDFAAETKPGLLQLSPRKLFVVWPLADAAVEAQRERLADQPVPTWPEFTLKINPLSLHSLLPPPTSGRSAVPGLNAEWTVAPDSMSTSDGLPKAGISTINSVESFAVLLYELLSGRPPLLRPGTGFTPLTTVNQEGNAVLRRALRPIGATGRFGSCLEFWTAFREASGTATRPAAKPGTETAAAAVAPITPPVVPLTERRTSSPGVLPPASGSAQATQTPATSPTVAPSAFAHVIPPEFLGVVATGTRLRLEPATPPAAGETSAGLPPPLAAYLVARPLFRLGRARKEVDLLTWFWPRDAEQDEKTKRLSKVHAIAELGPTGEIVVRDAGSANFTSFEGTALIGEKSAPLDHRGVLVLGNDYQIEIVPHASSVSGGLRVVNEDAWPGPPATLAAVPEQVRRGCVSFRPVNSEPALHLALWLFTDAKFGSHPGNALVFADPSMIGVQGRFHYYREQFWLEAFDGGSGLRVDEHVLAPGELVPLATGQKVLLGSVVFEANVEG